MRIRIIITLLLSLYPGVSPALGQGEVFSPKDQSFSVMMPGTPKCVSERVDLFGETIDMNICVYANERSQLFYSVTYYDRPRTSFAVDDKTALRAAVAGALALSKSRLVSEREMTVGGYSGMECVWRMNDFNISSTKLFVITKQKLVIADISGQPGKLPEGMVRAFLDSLRFTGDASPVR